MTSNHLYAIALSNAASAGPPIWAISADASASWRSTNARARTPQQTGSIRTTTLQTRTADDPSRHDAIQIPYSHANHTSAGQHRRTGQSTPNGESSDINEHAPASDAAAARHSTKADGSESSQ